MMKSSLFLAAVLVCGLVRAQTGGQPGGQPGGLPGGQPGGQPGRQPGGQPGGLPGGLPERVLKLEANIDILTKSRVAFSAALVETNDWTTKGPLEADQTLEFKRVITNIGNGYDPATGVFTAPVKGLYYIRVTGVAGPNGELHAGVKKDGENMFAIYQKAGTQAGASNAMVMALERGNRVFVQLWAGKTIADQGRLSTFTGFLVFPM